MALLRPALQADVGALVDVLGEPEVARWWGRYDPERVRGELVHPPHGGTFTVELDGTVVGLVAWYEETDPDYRHAGVDIAIGAGARGRGVGTDAIRTVARWLVSERGHHRLVIDPRADNTRAIEAYRRVGFRPVGVLRRYERAEDGTWHDGLLMDLLAEELEEFEEPTAST